MNIDIGLVVVIAAVLIFYLRLIILQRERVKRVTHAAPPDAKKTRSKARQPAPASLPRYSVLSQKRSDLVIAGIGALMILCGMALNAQWIPLPGLQTFWWLPTALGIVAFSWAFKL